MVILADLHIRKRGLLSKYKVVPSWLRSWLNVAIDLTGTTAMKLADYCLPMLTLSKELIPYKEGGIHKLLTFQAEYSFFSIESYCKLEFSQFKEFT